jgi:hypothetical protein
VYRVTSRILWIVALAAWFGLMPPVARADLASPSWYDQNAVGSAPDWHYRVPINLPVGAEAA